MPEPEGVKMSDACGAGMCGMDTASTEDGPMIYAGGAEGELKALAPNNLVEAVKALNLDTNDTGDEGLAVTAVAASPFGEELAVGLKNGDVRLYELPSLEFKTILTRFTAPVLGLDYGMKDGGVIAACSEEPGIKLVRRSDNSRILVLDEFDGGTKSLKWDPQGEFLAAAGFDGTVKVWKVDPSLDDLTTDVVHTESYFAKEAANGSLEFDHLGKISWHPEGKSLGVTGSPAPLMLARDSWERSIIVPENAEEEGHVKDITVTAFSPDGLHLATAALDGRVVLWDIEQEQAVQTFVNTEQENWRHLKWLDDLTVAALSIKGSVCTLKRAPLAAKVSTGSKASSAEDANGVEAEAGGDGKRESSSDKEKRGSSKHLFDEEAAEDNDGNVSGADTAEVADGADDVAAGDVTAGLDDSMNGAGDGGEDGGRYDNGDVGGDENMLDMTGPMEPPSIVPQVETTPLQDPFQPSSTPLGDTPRYLCWNRVGTIISVDEKTHNAVEIEFADKSAGRNQRFSDTWNFVMGALSSTGAVFASVAQEEGESTLDPSGLSVLYYKALGRHSAGEDWTRMMPAGETVLAVSVGRGWAAAATDRQLVRLFTASGLQGETVMLPGPVVTMVGGGDVLMVVFHKGEPLGESQNLGYQLLDVGGKRELSKGAVCLSPGSELTWLGASEEGMVVAMDSLGLVSALTRSFGWQWTPLLDTLKVSKNKKDRFWPVGVVTGKLLAATLKGGEEHPATYPRPVLTALALTAPCAKFHDEEDKEETTRFEKSFPAMEARARQRKFNLDRGLAMGDDDADAEEMEGELMAQQAALDTMLVKRIQEACAAEKAERAMDLASLLHLEKSYSIAIKVANHHGLTSLAAAMEDAMVAKFQGPEDEEDFDDERVEVLEDRGWMRGGASVASGGARGDEEEQNLGPLDRARLQEARRRKSEESVPPPPRPVFSSSSAGDRYGGDGGEGHTSETPADVGEDGDGAEIVDSDDDGGKAATVSPKAAGGGGGKRRMEEQERDSAKFDEDDEEEEDEEEEEVEAPPAPRNPFARGGKTFASPPRKKRKDVLETMNDLRSSPSPVSNKRPPLSRLSSFAAEARHKNRNDRNVL